MRFDGMNFRRSNTFSWRPANPETDVDTQDRGVESNYFVIVKIKDCETIRNDHGYNTFSTKGVEQCNKLTYHRTNMGRAKWRTHTPGYCQYIPGIGVLSEGEKWQSARMFLVHDNRVYTTTIKRKARVEENE